MFKRFPYWPIIIICLLLWGATIASYSRFEQKSNPRKLSQIISEDLQQKLNAYEQLKSNQVLLEKIYDRKFNEEELHHFTSLPFLFYIYKDGQLVFWNSNAAITYCGKQAPIIPSDSTRLERNIFYTKCDSLTGVDSASINIGLIVPLAWVYPFENAYLKSHWEASSNIPPPTERADKPLPGFIPIYDKPDHAAFYVKIPEGDVRHNVPNLITISLLLAAVLCTVIWIQLLALHIERIYSDKHAILFTIAVVISVRLLLYNAGLPFHLSESELFSPQLYASSYFLPSLGDLIINTVCITWIIGFIILHRNKRHHHIIRHYPLRLRQALFLVLAVGLAFYCFYFITIIRSIVMDSMISFDLSHYNATNIYTIVGLLTISLIMSASTMIIYWLNEQLNQCLQNKWLKYIMVGIAGLCCFLIYKSTHQDSYYFSYGIPVWTVIFLMLLDFRKMPVIFEVFSPNMIWGAIFLCASGALLLQYFNNEKERENRKTFAARLVRQKDPVTQYVFQDIASDIKYDDVIQAFFRKPTAASRLVINDRMDVLYLNGHLNKYQSEVYMFDANGKGLFNTDTVNMRSLNQRTSNGAVDADSILFFREDAEDGHNYTARIPISNPDDELLGYLFIDLALKKADNKTVYPELLQPGSISSTEEKPEYAYAVYSGDKLITQTSNFPFAVSQPHSHIHTAEYVFKQSDGSSELWYHPSPEKEIVVVYKPEKFWTITRLFSFLFGAQLLTSILFIVYRLLLREISGYNHQHRLKLSRIPLGKRIQYSVLGIVLVSFLFIGLATSIVLSGQYEKNTNIKLMSIMEKVENDVQQHLLNHHGLNSEAVYNAETRQQSFKYFITNLANQQRVDINVFDIKGQLNASSQSHIYDKDLLARIMRPDAYYIMHEKQVSSLIRNEKIGSLSYRSCYMPLRNESGLILGFLNIPYFSSEKELNEQISTVISALINLYALMFLLSGLFAVFFTRNLTRSLSIIIKGFNQVNLAQNKSLEWPYEDDEIGKLVQAYNRMVKKVEEQAVQLVQNEREGAWREMARQVAHEIKNPLTPMKLNIQYLQRAISNDHPNVTELASRVSNSLIEQIDNLSYIASEFSNFAKLPEAKPETIELNDFFEKQAELFSHKENVVINFVPAAGPLIVYVDHNQLLRICINLLQNAIQAIPDDRKGFIEVHLMKGPNDALISITDNGGGIPEEAREKIFKPYFTTKSSGTGLGLAMTKKMIQLSKGEIWFETETGKGTTFFIRLPLVKQ